MKKTIITILSKGYTTSKKNIEEIKKAFYPLKYLITNTHGITTCNSNKFWQAENNDNRRQLIADLKNAKLHSFKTCYFSIINRFEHGDAYGIDKNYTL